MQFVNGHIFVDGRFVPGGFSVEDGRFARVLGEAAEAPSVDLGGAYVIPGLVDIHTHGNSGADFSDGDYDGLVQMAAYLARNGVTSFAPASMTLPYDVLETAFRTAVRLHRTSPEGCARLAGIHMEGPFSPRSGRAHRMPPISACRTMRPFRSCTTHRRGCCASWTSRRSWRARRTLPAVRRRDVPSPWRTPTPPMRRLPLCLTRAPST